MKYPSLFHLFTFYFYLVSGVAFLPKLKISKLSPFVNLKIEPRL